MYDFENRIKSAAQRTWQAIGADVLQAAAVDSLLSEDVAECVLDYIEQYGKDPEAIVEFQKLGYEEKQAMILRAFPLPQYGW